MIWPQEASQLGDRAVRVLRWWTGELASLVPRRLKAHGPAPVEIACSRSRDGGGLAFDVCPSDRKMSRVRRTRIAQLALDDTCCLLWEAMIPAGAAGRIEEILALYLERTTPFRRDEVCFGYRIGGQRGDGLRLQVALIRRDWLSALLQQVFSLGFDRLTASCRDIPIRLPYAFRFVNPRARQAGHILNALILATAVVSASAALMLAFAQQRRAIAELDAAIELAQTGSLEVRKTYDNVAAVLDRGKGLGDRKLGTPTTSTIIAALTRILPDDAWISDLRIERGSVSMSGFSRSATELIAALDASPLFDDVEFAAPVFRDPQVGADRFQISLVVTVSPDGARAGS